MHDQLSFHAIHARRFSTASSEGWPRNRGHWNPAQCSGADREPEQAARKPRREL